jgi:uncharacterized protein (DUF488 family)
MATEVFSLGHSSLPFERFVKLLKTAGVSAVADVRSSPFSKRAPWFSQREFKAGLRDNAIAYAFLGEELGGRPKAQGLFRAGVADYLAMAETAAFKSGLDRLLQGIEKHRIALVCSERDPLHCHRCLLVARQLAVKGVDTRHIRPDGSEETQKEAEERLLREENLAAEDFLWPKVERISEAYLRRNKQVAYSLNRVDASESQWSSTR